MRKQTSAYILPEEVKHLHGKHLARYVKKLGKVGGWGWMFTYSLRMCFTDVKCKPGTLPDSMPLDLHCIIMLSTTPQITLDKISSPTKVWNLFSSLFQDGTDLSHRTLPRTAVTGISGPWSLVTAKVVIRFLLQRDIVSVYYPLHCGKSSKLMCDWWQHSRVFLSINMAVFTPVSYC